MTRHFSRTVQALSIFDQSILYAATRTARGLVDQSFGSKKLLLADSEGESLVTITTF
jgi:hypothetical protein